MVPRIISAILVSFITAVCSPAEMRGQSIDSLLHVIDNDLVKDDSEKYDLLCQVISEINDAETIIRYCDQAIELAQKLDIQPALPYLKKGEACLVTNNLAIALECFMEAAKYYEKNEDDSNLGKAYMNMAETYNLQGNRENEERYIKQAIEIFERGKDSLHLGIVLHNLGYSNYSMGQYDTALVLLTKALDLFEKVDRSYAHFSYYYCLGNLGLVHLRLSDSEKAGEYLLIAIDSVSVSKYRNEGALAEFMIGYAHLLQQKGEPNQAMAYASGALEITDISNYERDASGLIAELYANSGRFDSAYHYQSIFIVANDSAKNIENVERMADLRTEYEVGKKQAEVDVLEKIKLRNTIIIIGLGIILMLAIGLVTLYNKHLRRSRELSRALEERRVLLVKQSSELKEKNDRIIRANAELTQLNEEIKSQKEEIETQRDHLFIQNQAITSSISYAQRIQSAIFPPVAYFHEILNDVFILFRPRDIVSGDFYWIKQVNQFVILAAADCTGHGVPGAFMSMLGISYLNEIVQRREITQANQVLNELRKQVRNSLRQHGQPEESRDGMDMALCVIDEKNKVLQYSGANSPLYLIRDKDGTSELTEYKADPMPVGYYQGKFKPFTNHDIQLEFGDVFYLFSDGFNDQKGGEEGKKFLSKNFKKLLFDIHQEPMREQKNILDKTLTDWMGDHSQIDDILVIGVRV